MEPRQQVGVVPCAETASDLKRPAPAERVEEQHGRPARQAEDQPQRALERGAEGGLLLHARTHGRRGGDGLDDDEVGARVDSAAETRGEVVYAARGLATVDQPVPGMRPAPVDALEEREEPAGSHASLSAAARAGPSTHAARHLALPLADRTTKVDGDGAADAGDCDRLTGAQLGKESAKPLQVSEIRDGSPGLLHEGCLASRWRVGLPAGLRRPDIATLHGRAPAAGQHGAEAEGEAKRDTGYFLPF